MVWADARRCNFQPDDRPAQIPYPQATLNFHYEVELVVAIGKGGEKYFESPKQPGLIYGYAVGLDLTRRDLQNDAKENRQPMGHGERLRSFRTNWGYRACLPM